MAQKGTLLADDLRQRLELLELRFDQERPPMPGKCSASAGEA